MSSFRPSYEVHISPTPEDGKCNYRSSSPEFWIARGFSLQSIAGIAWQMPENRIVLSSRCAGDQLYDFVLMPPKPLKDDEVYRLLQQAVEIYFQITVSHESRTKDVYVLSAPDGKSPALRDVSEEYAAYYMFSFGMGSSDDSFSAQGITMHEICETVEQRFRGIVVDETHFTGRFTFSVKGSGTGTTAFSEMLRSQLGLLLTQGRRDIDMLIISAGHPHSREPVPTR